MAIIDPSEILVAQGSPRAGWLRTGTIAGVPVTITDFSKDDDRTVSYSNYALTPPSGNYQKVVHAKGTRGLGFSVSGDYTWEGRHVANFLGASYRGVSFTVEIQQASSGSATVMDQCYCENFTLQGAADGLITYNMSGKRRSLSSVGGSVGQTNYQHPLPGWASGNSNLVSWSLGHSVSLTPKFLNDNNSLPSYFRPGKSEITFNLTAATTLEVHDTISIAIGAVYMLTGHIQKLSEKSSGRDGHVVYEAVLTNAAALTPQTAGSSVTISNLTSDLPDAWPDGLEP